MEDHGPSVLTRYLKELVDGLAQLRPEPGLELAKDLLLGTCRDRAIRSSVERAGSTIFQERKTSSASSTSSAGVLLPLLFL